MSQPKEKRARVQQEPGSSLSFLQRTPSEDSAEAISGSAGLSDKKSMEIADTTPVQAVVLARTSRDAQSGIVLLSRDTFPRRLDTYAAPDVRTASDLAVYAKARAQDDYKRSLEFEGPAKVYDYNPTRVDPRALEEGNDVSLDLRRKALPNNTVLHGHLEPDTHEIVDTFFVLVTAFEKQRAEEKGEEAAPPDGELFRSIYETVENAVDACSYQLPTVFRLPEDHPFASGVNKRFIPCYPKDPSRPLLLMEGLATELWDPVSDAHVTVEQIRLIAADEKNALREAMKSHPTVLFGVSGAGKTQLICEMLAQEYGLLFVASRLGNGGCADLEEALAFLLNEVSPVRPHAEGPEIRQMLEENLRIANRIFQGVVLARLLLLRALKHKFGDELSYGLWLWMQLYPDAVFGALSEVASLFERLWRQCRRLSPSYMAEQVEALSREIAQTPKILCFVDEAQVLLEQLPNEFPSDRDHSSRRSCFSALVKSMIGLCAGPLMAGTGTRMEAATKEIATALGTKSTAIDVVFGRRGHLTPEACEAYILTYLSFEHEAGPNQVSAAELRKICQTLQGRPRFTERFVTLCLGKDPDTPVMQVLQDYVSTQVTGSPKPASSPENWWKISIYYALEELWGRLLRSKQVKRSYGGTLARVLSAFQRAALRYAMTGRAQVLRSPEHANLVEYGLANIQRVGDVSTVSICEPIVVRAASCYFDLLGYQDDRLLDFVGDLSTLGNEFESFVSLTLFDKRPLELSTSAPINVEGVEIPEAFVGEWALWYPDEAVTTGVLGCDSKRDVDLERFLGQDPHCVFLFPDVFAGSDVFERVFNLANQIRRLQVAIQLKFQKDVRDSDRAIATTSLEDIFTHSDGRIIETREETRARVLQAFRSTGLPLLRILVVYPGVVEDQAPVQVIGEKELLLVVDQRNAHVVFDEEDLTLLKRVYDKSRRQREGQPQPDAAQADESKQQSRKRANDPASIPTSPPKRRTAREPRPVKRYGFDA